MNVEIFGNNVNNPRRVDSQSSFDEVSDALYRHEKTFYRYCASGSGINPAERTEWSNERDRLTQLWHDKHPHKPQVDPTAVKGTGFIQRLQSIFRPHK